MVFKEAKVGDRVVMQNNLGNYSNKKGTIVRIFRTSHGTENIYQILIPSLDNKEPFNFYRHRFELSIKLYHYVI